jgi:hypothetical protein
MLEAPMTSLVGAVSRRKILPRRARAQNPQHPVQYRPRITPPNTATIRALPSLLIPLDKSTHILPLHIAQIRHTSDLLQLRPKSKCLLTRCVGDMGSRFLNH